MASKKCGRGRPFPKFDSEESFKLGLRLLKAAKVPYALAGRLAVWQYVPPWLQTFTKDVDFAVPYGRSEQVAQVARDAGLKVEELSIGGYGVTKGRKVIIDFIDRHPGMTELFLNAVKSAQGNKESRRRFGNTVVPIVERAYLIAMKLATGQRDDEADALALLQFANPRDYAAIRRVVVFYVKGGADKFARLLRDVYRDPGR